MGSKINNTGGTSSHSLESEIELGEVIDVLSGYAFKGKDFTSAGVPVIKIKNIVPPTINFEDVEYVSKELYDEKIKFSLKFNDILISLTGSGLNQMASAVGKVGRVRTKNTPLLLNQRVGKIIVKDDSKVDEDFLYYWISRKEIQYLLTASAGGSANQANISPSNIKKLKIHLPSLRSQREIKKILSSLDSKVELNNQIISNIEQVAQNLYKHWFVDFEFPNEDGQPYKSSGGEMVENERGLTPKGFLVQLLAESTAFLSGGTPKTNIKEYWDGGIPFFTPKDITGSVYVSQTLKTITELGLTKSNTKLYPKDTVFITARGTVGKLNLANVEMAMNQSCFALKQKQGYQFFLYFMLETLLRQIIQGSNGAVFNAINLKDLNILKIVKPTDALIANFEDIVIPLFNLMSEKEKENIALKEMRDTLLPKLLSGEIELPDEPEVIEHVPIP